MGIETNASIEIAAPPEAVFEWLCDRGKVAQWGGGDPTYLPEDRSELKAGYRGSGTIAAPDGARPIECEVTEYDPPHAFSFRMTYAGGDSISSYSLSPTGSGTRLEVSNDTDYGAMAKPSAEVEEQLERVPAMFRKLIDWQMKEVSEDIAEGKWDDNPMVVSSMEKGLEESLEKLKGLAEADQSS